MSTDDQRSLSDQELDRVSGGEKVMAFSPGWTLVQTDRGGLYLCGPEQCVSMPSPQYPYQPPK
jgi:hypothetical protein